MNHKKKDGSAGTLDPLFGDGGKVELTHEGERGNNPYAILALNDNKLLYADRKNLGSKAIRVRLMHSNGFFDGQFGVGGSVELFAGANNSPYEVGLCSYTNDKWLLTGLVYESESEAPLLFIARLNIKGELDLSFGEGGIATINLYDLVGMKYKPQSQATPKVENTNPSGRSSRASSSTAGSVVVQPDGRIVLPLTFVGAGLEKGLVIRLAPNGSPDKSFNGAGFVFVELEGIEHWASNSTSVAVQESGKITVYGTYLIRDEARNYVVRFKEDGQFDADFNKGTAVIIVGRESELLFAGSIAIRESDGAILVVGGAYRSAKTEGVIVVLDAAGAADPGFNGGQPLFSSMLTEGVGWDFCGWQKESQAIIVAGSGGSNSENASLLLARFLPDGSSDSSFNGQGWTQFNEAAGSSGYRDAAVMTDNKVVLCAKVYIGLTSSHGCLVRYLT